MHTCIRVCVSVCKTKRRTLNGRQIIMHLVSEEEKVRVMYYQIKVYELDVCSA